MPNSELFYVEPIFRPPSEGKFSLLITATVGCSFNCTFCIPYRSKKFQIRKTEDINQDITNSLKIYGNRVKRIFLLDGNAFIIKPKSLIEICNHAFKTHPNLERVTAYAHAKDILRKSDEDLKHIQEAGLKMVYVGIETGDNELLKKVNKDTTADELIEAAQKLHRSGIIFSGTIILGLAGSDPEKSRQHALATADVINKMNPPKDQPWYISALTLMLPPGTPIYQAKMDHKFMPITSEGALKELEIIMENLSDDLHGCTWRANHASNYLPLRGVLSKDRLNLLKLIKSGLQNPDKLKPEWYRGL